MDGDPAVHLGLFPTPTGNPLVIVDGIRKLLPEIQKTLPPDVRVDLAYETSRFIRPPSTRWCGPWWKRC